MAAANVKWSRVRSCGCLQSKHIKNLNKQNIKDKQFGRLTAVKPTNKRDSSGSIIWECICDCGNTVFYSVNALNKGTTQSCGCLYQETRKECPSLRKDVFDDTSVASLITKKKNQSNNSSGFRGVYLDRRINRWTGYINFKKKRYYLGSFEKKEDAIQARIAAEQKLYDPFILDNWEKLSEHSKNILKILLKKQKNTKQIAQGRSKYMRAGRLGEILSSNDTIYVCFDCPTSSKGYLTEWNADYFTHKFPDVEVIKIMPFRKKILLFVYEYTAKALYEKRYEDVIKYSNEVEIHTFNSDLEYIRRCIER